MNIGQYEIRIAENIRALRKERQLTQEMLAEILGVTVGAVYKWESGKSVPDWTLIFEMANLFGVSTDVLLGYAFDCKSPQEISRTILSMIEDERAEQAVAKAEQSIKKFPNDFDLIYASGLAYTRLAEQKTDRDVLSQGIELLERACVLLPMKQYEMRWREDGGAEHDFEGISEASIKRIIAKSHLLMGDFERGLHILRENNVCGVNNALIGMVLADYYHDADRAEGFIRKALADSFDDINFVVVGYVNLSFQRGDYGTAIEGLKWLRKIIRASEDDDDRESDRNERRDNQRNDRRDDRGDGSDDRASAPFERYDCILLESIAEGYFFAGESERGEEYLKRAIEAARRIDCGSEETRAKNRHLFADIHLTKMHSFINDPQSMILHLESKVRYCDHPKLTEAWKRCGGHAVFCL